MNYNQWDEVTLSEVTDKIGDGLHGTPKYDDLGEYFFVNGNNLNGKITIDNRTKRVSHSEYLKYKKDLNNTTILLSINGTLGKLAFYNGERVILGKSACYINVKNEVHKKFIYYTLQSTQFLSYLGSHSSGTTIKNLGLKEIRNFSFGLPNYITQKAIANILSSLDDKIELNNKINKNLEELAQTLYKRWFVDFEFPNEDGEPYKSSGGKMVDSELGKIPMDWSIKSIGDYSTVKSGYAFKSAWWSNKGLGVIKIKDLNDITINENNLDRVEHFYATKAMEFSVNFGDILIAMTGATLGKIGIVSSKKSNLYVNQRVGKFFLGEHPIKKLPFLHNLLRNKDILEEIVRRGSGSAQSNISPSDIMSIKIPYKKEVINSFNIIFEYIYKTYLNNLEQNKILSKTRDELLPKLMNGEIEVPIEE